MHVGIVGGGIAGLATAWALARRDIRVTLFEQAAIPNPLSASGDQHRLIRRGYGSLDGYARTIDDAFRAWDDMFADTGADGFVESGVLCISETAGDDGSEFIEGYDRMGVAYDDLPAAAAAERFPFLDAATFQRAAVVADGGVLLCEVITEALVAWLEAKGVTLRAQTPVAAIDAARATVRTADGEQQFDRLVVAAGAWVTALLPELEATLHPYRTLVTYLKPPGDLAAAWEAAPGILSVGSRRTDGYVLPPVRGTELKFGTGLTKHPGRPDPDWSPTLEDGIAVRGAFAPPFARIEDYEVTGVRSCVYTFTDDETFRGFELGRAHVVSACSGHGYKFGAAVGLKTAEAILSGNTRAWQSWLRAEA
ncbi:MAG: FAD-dependent oxidoreductase [Pseudomonadota bacterium]